MSLRSLFHAVTSLSVATFACGGSTTHVGVDPDAGSGDSGGFPEAGRRPDAGIDNAGFTLNVCDAGGTYIPLAGVTATPPVDFLELRYHDQFNGNPDGGPAPFRSIATSGVACGTATNPAACNATLANLSSSVGWSIGGGGPGPPSVRYIAYTRADEVGAVTSLDALARFLSTIENVKDAALLLSERGHRFTCSKQNARETSTGFELITQTGQTCGAGTGIDENLVSVTFGGAITIEKTVRIEDGNPNCAIGRRPLGFAPTRSPAESALGAYFAEMAELEAASVYAFEELADELSLHGAPPELVNAARASARDEVRHTKTTAHLAARFGASIRAPRVEQHSARGLLEIAVENAVEGCVRETFGALQATFQSKHAADAGIQRAMRVIAEDETRHAALAWDIAAWIEPLLSPSERARVSEARRGAVRDLARGLATETHPDVSRRAGVPSAPQAAWLLDSVRTELWSGPTA